VVAGVLATVVALTVNGPAGAAPVSRHAQLLHAVRHDTSLPLRDMLAAPALPAPLRVLPLRTLPQRAARAAQAPSPRGVQTSFGRGATLPLGVNVLGVGYGFSGPLGSFTPDEAPADPNAAVGPSNIVETVNADLAVFDKSGTPIYGPVPTNTLWSGFGGDCETHDDGDATATYDRIADRWVIQQMTFSTGAPYFDCVAVSQTPDPTGGWYRYAFSYGGEMPDYPKLSVWPDAYYLTFNRFSNNEAQFDGPDVCALDRSSMLQGAAASQQCFPQPPTQFSMLAADLDGSLLPPAGSPEYVLALAERTNQLEYWKLHVDWATPANSTLSGPTGLQVNSYTELCRGGELCVPQAGTSETLDSLGDRLMYRLAYRNLGDRESLVVSHSVAVGLGSGIRWYELQPDASHNLSVVQQGTYGPDSAYRWMGSIAEDQSGDMALGFSLSSSSLHPSIHYTGRLAGDPAGQMTQGEGAILDGVNSQTETNRWGDYSSMQIDPTDDCTFWYAQQYIVTAGTLTWGTRIASLRFPSCAPADFAISSSPTSVSTPPAGSGTATISTALTSGRAEPVSLSVTGLPAGASASFAPTSVTTGGSSTLTIDAGTAAPGDYPLTVTGTSPLASHTTSVDLTITPPPNDFAISADPASVTVASGASGTSTISTQVTSGSAESVDLSVSGLPSGASASFDQTPIDAGDSATLTIWTGTAAPGDYPLTVTGTAPSATHTIGIDLTITPPPNDFAISADPASVTVPDGSSGTSTISTQVTSGSAESIDLGLTGLPAGATASFSPATISGGDSSTLTISAGTADPGDYTLTVTGTAPSATHSTSIDLTVTNPFAGVIRNGGFEAGSLTGWKAKGTTGVASSGCHAGSFCAQLGLPTATKGSSSIAQLFRVPAGASTLSLWYEVVCHDVVRYDWASAKLTDRTTGTRTMVLPKTCNDRGAWVQITAPVIAGHTYRLALTNHDDGFAGDPTFTLFDDVTLR
jgi:hypothetical protein